MSLSSIYRYNLFSKSKSTKMATIEIQTQNYQLLLLRPEMVTDAWVSWVSNSALMRQVNARPRKATKADVQNFMLDAMAKQRAMIGVFTRPQGAHVGICEILFDQNHRNMNLEILIDFKVYNFNAVMDEILPPLLTELKSRFGAEKAAIVAPETYKIMLAYLAESAWHREGLLRAELPHATENRRINSVQFGLIL